MVGNRKEVYRRRRKGKQVEDKEEGGMNQGELMEKDAQKKPETQEMECEWAEVGRKKMRQNKKEYVSSSQGERDLKNCPF